MSTGIRFVVIHITEYKYQECETWKSSSATSMTNAYGIIVLYYLQ